MTKAQTRAVGYVRVSTSAQAEYGESLKVQTQAIKDYCSPSFRELNLLRIYTEPGVSGYKSSRPELDKLMAAAERKEFDTIIFYEFSRFAWNTADLLTNFKKLQELDISLVSIKQDINTSGHYGQAMLGILAVIDELERSVIKQRTDDGRTSKLQDGRAFWGHTPFGYKFNKDAAKVEHEPTEAATYRHIVKRYHDFGISMIDLAIELNKEHVPCRRASKSWSAPTLSGILRNPIYFNRTYVTPKGYRYDIEPMISKTRWDLVQDRIQSKRLRSGKPGEAARNFLLYRQLRCGLCGSTLSSIANKERRDYVCHWRRAPEKLLEGHAPCNLPYFDAWDVEWDVLGQIRLLIIGENQSVFENQKTHYKETLKETTLELDRYKKLLRKKELAQRGLPKALESGLDPVRFANLDRQYTHDIGELSIVIDEKQEELDSLENADKERAFVKKFQFEHYLELRFMTDRMLELPFEKKQRLIKGLLSDLITIHPDGKLDIPWKFNYDLIKEILGKDSESGSGGENGNENNPGPNGLNTKVDVELLPVPPGHEVACGAQVHPG
jgi:site-specific DNA recombinase